MQSMQKEDFLRLVEATHEQRNIEFKPAFHFRDTQKVELKEKVIQTLMGLANTKGGGYLLLGIKERAGGIEFQNMSAAQIRSFEHDSIKATIDGYTSSSVSFEVYKAEDNEGDNHVVMRVSEFSELPIICKRTSSGDSGILEEGAVYCRTKDGQVGTKKVGEAEMREIIELAVDKNSEKLEKKVRKIIYSALDIEGEE